MTSENAITAGPGGRAFVVCGTGYLALAGAVALLHTAGDPVIRGWWLVAFLSLVGGVSQILLGPGLLALVRRNGGQPPGPRAVRAELMLWNGGTATVAIADLASSMAGVLVGSVLLVIALVLFAGGFREALVTARRPARAWVRSYALLLGFLAASVVVGVLLAYTRGR